MTPTHGAALASLPRRLLSLRVRVFHSITRAAAGLLGPCFKTGRFEATFMRQSFALKQHYHAKNNYRRGLRKVVPLQPPMTQHAPTRRQCSIPPSNKRPTSHASTHRGASTNTRALSPVRGIDASYSNATLNCSSAKTSERLSRSITSI